MKREINVSAWILNYNAFIANSLPYFDSASIIVGSDDWEDFLERSFEIFVVNRIGEEFGYWTDLTYGTWDETHIEGGIRSINVKVSAGKVALIGERIKDSWVYRREILTSALVFAMRQFSYPFAEAEDLNLQFKHVEGTYPQGRVCIPIEDCSFFVTA